MKIDAADLQDNLFTLEVWQQKWNMEFNPSKSKIMCLATKEIHQSGNMYSVDKFLKK